MDEQAIIELSVQALNISLMLSVGLELHPKQLLAVLKRIRLISTVLLLNFVVIPAVGFGLASAVSLMPAVAAGLVLSACAPGGGMGTLLTRVAGGALELSVVMLVLLTGLSVAITPMTVSWMLGSGGDVGHFEVSGMVKTLLLFQLAPLVLGLTLHVMRPRWAQLLNKVAKPVSNLLFVGEVIGLTISKFTSLGQIGTAGLLVCAATVVASLLLTMVFRGSVQDRAAVSLTTIVRNIALSMLLAAAFFPDPLVMITVLAYGMCQFSIGLVATGVIRGRIRRAVAT